MRESHFAAVKRLAWKELAHRLDDHPEKFSDASLIRISTDAMKLELSQVKSDKPDAPKEQTNVLAIIGSAAALPPERRAELAQALTANVADFTAAIKELEPAKPQEER